jgi:hypothetical protein
MKSYKVNFKRFIRSILQIDLPALFKTDPGLSASLGHFTAKGSIDAFQINHEKHFRMQFVMELVSALVQVIKSQVA